MSINRESNGKYYEQQTCVFCGRKIKQETFQHGSLQYANLLEARIIKSEFITPVCEDCGDVWIEENAEMFDTNQFWHNFFKNFKGKATISLRYQDEKITINSGIIKVNNAKFDYEIGVDSLSIYIEKAGVTFSKFYSFNEMIWETI